MRDLPKLQATGISVTFEHDSTKTEALRNVDLTVNEGEFVILLGPSGCGKSTLLYVIGGFVPPSSGYVYVDGKPVNRPGPDRGIVFQHFALFPWLTVARNISLGLELKGLPREDCDVVLERWLGITGLTEFRQHLPGQLSGGMQQRVAVARALAAAPEVVLMDEPFGALDEQTKRGLIADLQRIWTEAGTSVVFVTHSVDEALLLGDRVVVMSRSPGRVKTEIKVDLPRPRNDTDQQFVDLKRIVLSTLAQEHSALRRETDAVSS